MIIDINKETVAKIENKHFFADALRYVKMYEDFKGLIRKSGMDLDSQDHEEQKYKKIKSLKQKNAVFRNDDKSIYLNKISPACLACKTGTESETFFISLQCNKNCYFCSNRNQENYQYYLKNNKEYIREIENAVAKRKELNFVGLTGGEPLLFKDDTINILEYVLQKVPKAFTRLYTNGDFIDESILKQLKKVGLHEIRYSLKIDDYFKGNKLCDKNLLDKFYNKLTLTKKYIPNVMIEMPVIPGTKEIMKEILYELERRDIFGINLLEFLYSWNNLEDYRKRAFKIKHQPYKILYDYTYAGGLPISGSELECLELLKYAVDSNFGMGVHYCSLENKLISQVFAQNAQIKTNKIEHLSNKDYFIKTAKAYGGDLNKVLNIFKKNNCFDYAINTSENYIEFNVNKISLLQGLKIELGISSSIVDADEQGRKFIRELKIDLTYPKAFEFKTDV